MSVEQSTRKGRDPSSPVKHAAEGCREGFAAVAVLAAVRLPILAELLVRDPSIRLVLSGSKAVDYYVRNAYPRLRVIRVDDQRLRLPAKLLVAWWGARRMRRRTLPTRVYLLDAYFCAALIAAVRWSYVTDLVVNRHVDPEDYLREHAARNAPRRLALALMRNVLKLPVTYYSWGKGRWLGPHRRSFERVPGWSQGIRAGTAGLRPWLVEASDGFDGARPPSRVDAQWLGTPAVGGLSCRLRDDKPADAPMRIPSRDQGASDLRSAEWRSALADQENTALRSRRPDSVPGRTIILGMFTTALTTHEGLAVCSIARLCRPKDQALYKLLTDEVRRLSASVRFVASIDELIEVACRNVAPKRET